MKGTTRKRTPKKVIQTVPELRRAIEHMDEFTDALLVSPASKETMVKEICKEWASVFMKKLDKKSATTFLMDRMEQPKRTTRKRGGGPLAGAPLEYTTRAGVYLPPGQIPLENGGLPQTGSSYGHYVQYVGDGFFHPHPAQQDDPVMGQSTWPVPPEMGSNQAGGSRRIRRSHTVRKGKKRTVRRGGAWLSQAFSHPISSSSPPSILQDMQDMSYGKQVGASSDQVQRSIPYQVIHPKPVTF